MNVVFGSETDFDSWMSLVRRIAPVFPGLEQESDIIEHGKTVLKFMSKLQALCVKENGAVVGVLLFSRNRNMICCLGVSPEHRRRGIASALLKKALSELDPHRDVTVSTFVESDPRGEAPRALYRQFGFQADALTDAYGCPNQIFLRKAN